jgi:hypothetical protein
LPVLRKAATRSDSEAYGEHHRNRGHAADRDEILLPVELDLAIDHRHEHGVGAAHVDQLTVGGRIEHPLRREHAAGARDVLDDHLASEAPGHGLADDARDEVGAAARGVANDQGDRPVGLCLDRGGQHGAGGAGGELQGQSSLHDRFPFRTRA